MASVGRPRFPKAPPECVERGCTVHVYMAFSDHPNGAGWEIEHDGVPMFVLTFEQVAGDYWPTTALSAFEAQHAAQDAQRATETPKTGSGTGDEEDDGPAASRE
jgi:hypothetical protein